jgi:hypothetical protein
MKIKSYSYPFIGYFTSQVNDKITFKMKKYNIIRNEEDYNIIMYICLSILHYIDNRYRITLTHTCT